MQAMKFMIGKSRYLEVSLPKSDYYLNVALVVLVVGMMYGLKAALPSFHLPADLTFMFLVLFFIYQVTSLVHIGKNDCEESEIIWTES